ncbi:MAG: hypothetical protein JXA10_17710, partial [Anaerolineae bacterium]|nr:hypothetical protein [Anaerolineae bacterium]
MAENDNVNPPVDDGEEVPVTNNTDADQPQAEKVNHAPDNSEDLKPRLERLGGEPAPDITPEEFARLQQAGQIHIDPRGRVRTTQREESDAGISLRKRRAWYA